MTVPTVRKRARRPKTRTGCRTCKERHVRCDETGFPCFRCVRAGRTCGGYASTTKGAEGNMDIMCRPQIPQRVTSPLSPAGRTSLEITSAAEIHALDLFRKKIVWTLPGCSLAYKTLLLQALHEELVLAHAAVAVGLRWLGTETTDRVGGTGLYHYNKALSHISGGSSVAVEGATHIRPEVVLLASLLFFFFECLSEEGKRAAFHFEMGTKILYEKLQNKQWDPANRLEIEVHPVPRNDMDVILATFIQLDSDLSLACRPSTYLEPYVASIVPERFTSLEEARAHLVGITADVERIFREGDDMAREDMASNGDISLLSPEQLFCLSSVYSRLVPADTHPELSRRMRIAKDNLQAWWSSFEKLSKGISAAPDYLLMQIEFLDLWINVSMWKDEEEALCDRFKDDFARLVRLCGDYATLHISDSINDRTCPSKVRMRPVFALGSRVVSSLVGVAHKCRDSALRRDSIDLIRQLDMRGVCDSEYLAALLETIVEIEESNARGFMGYDHEKSLLQSDITNEARILEFEMCPESDEFWNLDEGRMVYASNSETGCVELHDATFQVRRVYQKGSSATP